MPFEICEEAHVICWCGGRLGESFQHHTHQAYINSINRIWCLNPHVVFICSTYTHFHTCKMWWDMQKAYTRNHKTMKGKGLRTEPQDNCDIITNTMQTISTLLTVVNRTTKKYFLQFYLDHFYFVSRVSCKFNVFCAL